tara:strand:- start:2248 stop:2808 length:561 start_codon:yes stop_codon:yes gene_type:complete
MKRDSFIFYRSFFEASKHLNTEQKSDLFSAICSYSLDNEEIELDDMCSAMFSLIKPQLEANYKRWQNGCKKKQIISKPQAKQKQKRSKTQANVNVNVNDNVNVNENIYRKFAHLQISVNDYEKLIKDYSIEQVVEIIDQIENYKGNTKYKNLYLTAKNWLKKDAKNDTKKKRASDFNAKRAFGVSL